MKLISALATLSALPFVISCPGVNFIPGVGDYYKDDVMNETYHRHERRYAEVISKGFRRPWPRLSGYNNHNTVRFCYADAETRKMKKHAFEEGIILWEQALGSPSKVTGHNLYFKEALDEKGHPIYCYEDEYSGIGTGWWNTDLPSWTLVVHHVNQPGAFSGQTGFIPNPDDPSKAIDGRHYIAIGYNKPEDKTTVEPFIVAHELGHVIGMTHEHQRTDRDKWILFQCSMVHDYDECMTRAMKDFPENKRTEVSHRLCNDGPFAAKYGFAKSLRMFIKGGPYTKDQWADGPGDLDFDSIMIYESDLAANKQCKKDGKWDISYCPLVRLQKSPDGHVSWTPFVNKRKPSKGDVAFVKRFYPFDK